MTQPTLAQPLGGWFKPADRIGHLVAFLRVHEIVTEMDELASKGKPAPVYRDVYVVDLVDLHEGGPNAVVQRRIKVGHAGIAGRLDTENKTTVLGVVGQGEAKDRNTSAPWILLGHTPEQGKWFTEAWWPGYAAQLAREGGGVAAQPAQRVAAPTPDPAPQQQWQQPYGQQQFPQPWQQPYGQQQPYPQNGGDPYQGVPGAYPQQQQQQPQQWQQPQQQPQQWQQPPIAPSSAPPAPNGTGPAPGASQPPPPVPTAATPPQAVPHAWPAGAVPQGAASVTQAPPPAAGQAPAGYPGQAPPAAPPVAAAPLGVNGTLDPSVLAGMPPGLDPAAVDPGTAALMAQMWPGSTPVGVPGGVPGA